jgi:hypothetical protein
MDAVTKELKVKFLAPVRTPGIVVVRVESLQRKGRAIYLQALVLQEGDGSESEKNNWGRQCALGEAVFVTPKRKEEVGVCAGSKL